MLFVKKALLDNVIGKGIIPCMVEGSAAIPLARGLEIERGRVDVGSLLHSIVDVFAELNPEEVKISQVNADTAEVTLNTWRVRSLLQYFTELPEIQVIAYGTYMAPGINEKIFEKKLAECRWDEETKRRVAAYNYSSTAEFKRDMRERLNFDGTFSFDKELREREKWATSRAEETLGNLEPMTQQELNTLIKHVVRNEVFNHAADHICYHGRGDYLPYRFTK